MKCAQNLMIGTFQSKNFGKCFWNKNSYDGHVLKLKFENAFHACHLKMLNWNNFFLLVSHLRLCQRRNDPVVGWLNLFVVIILYQQQPIGSTYKISFLNFQHIRRVETCNLSHKFQPSHGCIYPLSVAVTRLIMFLHCLLNRPICSL